MGCGSSADGQNTYKRQDKSIWRGKLNVWLRKASIKKDFQFLGEMDPYVKLTFGKQMQKSTVCEDGGQFPDWKGEQFEFVRSNEDDVVYVQVWNDNLTGDDFIGEGGFALTKVRKDTVGKIDAECEIYGDGEFVGTVEFEIDFALDPECVNHPQVVAPDTTGTVIVRPRNALLQKDFSGWFSGMNPIAVVQLGDDKQSSAAHIEGGMNPKWGDQLIFTRDTIARDTFIIELQNFSESSDNTKIGVGWASITPALPLDVKHEHTLTIYNQGEIVGNVSIEMEFISDDPLAYQENKDKPPPKQEVQPEQQQEQQEQPQQQQAQPAQVQPVYVAPQKPQSGYGRWNYNNGAYYEGEWLNGMRHGNGKFIFSARGVTIQYEGQFLNDAYNGQGKLTQGNFVYDGQFVNGVKQGQGIGVWNGTSMRYEGAWENNNYHGEGKFTDQNGRTSNNLYAHGRVVRNLDMQQQFQQGTAFNQFIGGGRMLQQNVALSSNNGQFQLRLGGGGELRLYEGGEVLFEIDDFGDSEDEEVEKELAEMEEEMRQLKREEKRAAKKQNRKMKLPGGMKGFGGLGKIMDKAEKMGIKMKMRQEQKPRKINQRKMAKLRQKIQEAKEAINDDDLELRPPYMLQLGVDGDVVLRFGPQRIEYYSAFEDDGFSCANVDNGMKLVVTDQGDINVVNGTGEVQYTLNIDD